MKLGAKDLGRIVAAMTFFAGGAAGCNFIVGVGDYSVGDAEVSGPDATQGGDDTGTGVDVVSEPAADTGSTADVHDAGLDRGMDAPRADAEAGHAPDADASVGPIADADAAPPGSDASDGAPPGTCGASIPTSQAFKNLVATCVYVASCDPLIVPIDISDCVTTDALHALGPTGPTACVSNITSCEGYYACEGIRLATASECPTFDSACTGNVAYDCNVQAPSFGQVTNCGAIPGGSCVLFTAQGDVHTTAQCVVQQPCTDIDAGEECLGNDLAACVLSPLGSGMGVEFGRSCGNATCTTGAGGSCTFEGTGLCSDEVSSTCVGGSVTQTCDSPNGTFNYGCGTSGSACVQVTPTSAQCVLPNCPANSNCTESCDSAHTISVCIGGAPYNIDCTQYGFGSCGVVADNLGVTNFAYCAP